MEWKQESIPKTELDKKQTDYMKEAMEMAKRSKTPPQKKQAAEKPAPPKPVEVERIVEKIVEVEKPVVIEKIIEKPVEVERIVEKIVEVPVVVEKIMEVEKIIEVEKPVVIEKIVEKAPVIIENKPELHLNQSKTIEINADLDVNINAAALIAKGKELVKAAPPAPEMLPEPEEIHFPEPEVIAEVCCREETEFPFEDFKSCDEWANECGGRPRHRRHCCESSTPPNFNNFINEHNKRSCHDGTHRRPSGSGRPPAGGFSWKDFKKN